MPSFIQSFSADTHQQREALVAGLRAPQPHIEPKHLYDRLGSMLFAALTELPEYYPTRTEATILSRHGQEIVEAIRSDPDDRELTLIDLGAGDCVKAMKLLPLLKPARYVAVDISVEFLRDALTQAARQHPQVEMLGVGLDFAHDLDLPPAALQGRAVVFYPGSSIGNFTPPEALAFLRRVRERCGGGLLIGVDLVKSRETLEAAYDDEIGLTAAFNLNLLRHVNRLIGADFRPRDWQHRALWVAERSRIEMHLVAREDLTVHWTGGSRRFAAGEHLHTENSCKYTPASLRALLHEAGYARQQLWTDERAAFAVVWARG